MKYLRRDASARTIGTFSRLLRFHVCFFLFGKVYRASLHPHTPLSVVMLPSTLLILAHELDPRQRAFLSNVNGGFTHISHPSAWPWKNATLTATKHSKHATGEIRGATMTERAPGRVGVSPYRSKRERYKRMPILRFVGEHVYLHA